MRLITCTHFVLLFFLFCNYCLNNSNTNEPQQLVLNAPFAIDQQQLQCIWEGERVIERLTFDSDVYLEKDELLYLLDFEEGDSIDTQDIVKAIGYLRMKQKFKEIYLQITEGVHGKWFHITLIGFWTFRTLKIKGILRGKDLYRQCYVMESGDQFDATKHNHSLEKIRSILHEEGYFKSAVTSSFFYDHETKSVDVTFNIHRGNRFRIGKIDIELKSEEQTLIEELSCLKKQIHKRFFRCLFGNYYTKTLLNDCTRAINRYLSQKVFLHVVIELHEQLNRARKRVYLCFSIDLHHKRSFIFFGNRFFSRQQLMDTILAFGRSAWLLPASILSEEIVRMYHSKGFCHVEVKAQEEGGRYFFIIKEGLRAIVKDIELRNALSIDYKIIIKRCFGKLVRRKYYDEQLVQKSLDVLRLIYLKQGFLDFTIVGHDIVQYDDTNNYSLVISLDEGPRSYLKNIIIESFPKLVKEGPFRAWYKKREPIPFDITRIAEQRKWLQQYLNNRGFAIATVKPEIDTDDEHNVSVSFTIDYGDRVNFGKTIVQGSSKFPFAYVKRELRYDEGDSWDQEKVRASFLRLKELEIFESIHFYPYQHSLDEKKPIVLKLKHDDPFEIRVRAGMALEHVQKYQTLNGITYRIGGAFLVKNPLHVGDQLRLDADFTRVHREIVGKYVRPWLLGMPIRSIFKGYSIKYEQPGFIGSDRDVYTVTQHGFLVGIQGKNRYFEGGVTVGVEWMKTTITDTVLSDRLARAIHFEPQLLDQTIPFFFLEPTLFIDYLDHKLNPTRGSFTIASLKGMFPLTARHSDSYFVKLLVEQSFFVPLGSVVGAFRLRFGHIFHRVFSAIMPTERFYLGGSRSLRSFETDLAPPLSTFVDEEGKEQIVPRGGKSMVNVNVEFRFPLFKKMGGVIFTDLGVLSGDDFADFKAENLLGGSGFGIRFYTPLGPLRFDIGWKWRKTDVAQRLFAWFLTFGHAF